ncbi:MAG TPA: sugar phosphate isomerase/epimerase [Sphingomonas sp.]|nr:sugar phosphate isomerase/epimerase [Sphingomonas sp.]
MALGHDDLVLCGGTLQATPLLDRLEPARAAGFAGISMFATDLEAVTATGMTVRDVRERIADAGLQVAEFDCVGKWLGRQEPKGGMPGWLAELLMRSTPDYICALAAEVGARSVTVIEMFGIDFDADDMAESFAAVCDTAAAHGLRAHLEFLPVGGIRSLAQGWEVVRRADRPNGGLHVDAWHLFRSGSRLSDLASVPGEKVYCVQLCDGPEHPAADPTSELMRGRLMPGEGAFDLTGFVRAIDAIGCAAPWSVEVFSDSHAGQLPAEVARRAAEATRRVIQQAREGI